MDVPVSILASRLEREQVGFLQGYQLLAQLEDVRKDRLPFYSQADVHIRLEDFDDRHLNPEALVSYITVQLVQFLRERGKRPKNTV